MAAIQFRSYMTSSILSGIWKTNCPEEVELWDEESGTMNAVSIWKQKLQLQKLQLQKLQLQKLQLQKLQLQLNRGEICVENFIPPCEWCESK